jgi:hypothetical protein
MTLTWLLESFATASGIMWRNVLAITGLVTYLAPQEIPPRPFYYNSMFTLPVLSHKAAPFGAQIVHKNRP